MTQTQMKWTEVRAGYKQWQLDADPSYVVDRMGLGSYWLYVGGKRVDGHWGRKEDAMVIAEARYNDPQKRITEARSLIELYGNAEGDNLKAVLRNVDNILAGIPLDMTDMP